MNAHKNIPIGVDNFAELADPNRNYHFVDKSLFIKEIIDDASKVSLITRPRRWGKTLNLSMLEHFLAPEISNKGQKGLFDHLTIAQIEHGRYLEYQGQHPVILISFKEIKCSTFDDAIKKISSLFQSVFRKHTDRIMNSDHLNRYDKDLFSAYLQGTVNTQQLENALLILSELLHKHYSEKSVYILIDEYDTPLNHAYSHHYLEPLTQFMKNLLGAALKGNPYLEKGVMTGILRISKDSMLSGLNNVEVYSVMHRAYATHFGFSDTEVKRLFVESGLECDMQIIHEYYNGYQIGGQSCYNPWSIMACIKNDGELCPYWVNTADDSLLRNAFLNATSAMKMQLQTLISTEKHSIETTVLETISFENIEQDRTSFWTLLVSTGYLTPLQKKRVNLNYECTLSIPNQEVKQLYINIFQSWFASQLTDVTYFSFLEDLAFGRIDMFTKKLGEYLLTYGSYHDFTSESNYHTFMLGLLCSLTDSYLLYSNTEAGQGRADIILISRKSNPDHAIIMEFKRDASDIAPSETDARKALQQINTKQYHAFLLRHPSAKKILKIGIAFNGKHVASCYEWEKSHY